MAELCSPVALLTIVYIAALAGHVSALALREWLRRGGRLRSMAEATGCALLGPLSILVIPLAPLLYPQTTGYFAAMHDAWHHWENILHTAPAVHSLLHIISFLLLATALVCLARAVYGFARMRELAATLKRAQPQPLGGSDLPLFSLSTARPFCFTVGMLRPRIYISTGLLQELSPRDQQAVLAHEAAHVRRRDGGMNAFLRGFYTLFPLPGSLLVRHEWERAAERACDTEAAQQVGNPCDVAAALVKVARLVDPRSVPGAAYFAASGEDIAGRVHALLALPASGHFRRERRPVLVTGLIVLHLLALLVAETWIRHFVELLVHH